LCDWLVAAFTAVLHNLLLGGISLLCRCGLLLQTWVSWCVCLSIGRVDLLQLWALQMQLNQSRCNLGCWLGWAQGTMC